MTEAYSLQDYCADLRAISAQTSNEDEILRRVGPLAQRFVADRSWLEPRHYETDAEQGFGVHLLHEEPDHSLAVLVLSWLPGRGTPPHDHGTWAVPGSRASSVTFAITVSMTAAARISPSSRSSTNSMRMKATWCA